MAKVKAWKKTPTKGTHPRSKATALHEAAHAVVAHKLGGVVAEVYVVGENGFCNAAFLQPSDPLVRAIVLMAGSAADHKWNKRPALEITKEDLDGVKALGFGDLTQSTVLALARDVVDKEAGLIQHIGKALAVKDLSGKQFLKLVKEYEAN